MAKKTESKELQIVDFSTFNIQQLPEFKGKKEEIKSVIKANPVVKITDTASYELAKKSRTAVRSTRTGLENEKKEVANKIKTHVLNVVNNEYDLLIEEVRSAESLRQEEVTRWEDIKEQERLERLRLEQERVDGIKAKIEEIGTLFVNKIQELSFASISEFEEELTLFKTIQDKAYFQEFEVLYNDKMDYIDNLFAAKRKTLTEQEEICLEQIRLAEERAENERKQRIQNSISGWYNDWSATIDSLNFFNYAGYFKNFQEEKVMDCQEFQSEFAEKRTLLVQKFESKIALLNQIEENRIVAEKLAQEKADFEEKQRKAKIGERSKNLKTLNIDLDSLLPILGVSKHSLFVNALNNFPDDAYEVELKELLDLLKAKEPVVSEQQIQDAAEEETVVDEEDIDFNKSYEDAIENLNELTGDSETIEVEFEEENPIKKVILNTIEDLCSNFLFYNRKEDENLSIEQLNEAVKSGFITIDEMVEEFRKHLTNTFKDEQ
jgi:hypothetical protein